MQIRAHSPYVDFLQSGQEILAESARLFDLPEYRFYDENQGRYPKRASRVCKVCAFRCAFAFPSLPLKGRFDRDLRVVALHKSSRDKNHQELSPTVDQRAFGFPNSCDPRFPSLQLYCVGVFSLSAHDDQDLALWQLVSPAIWRLPPMILLIHGLNRRKVQLVNHAGHEINQVVIRQPFAQTRR